MTNAKRLFCMICTKYLGSCEERLGNRMHRNGVENDLAGEDLTTRI